jgi:hypothetical protein
MNTYIVHFYDDQGKFRAGKGTAVVLSTDVLSTMPEVMRAFIVKKESGLCIRVHTNEELADIIKQIWVGRS